MDTINKISSLKEIVKTKIEHALKKGDTKTIVIAAKDLEILEHLEKLYREIETSLISLTQKIEFNIDTPQYTWKSYKQIGKEERKIFVQNAKNNGIILSEEKGPLYRNKLGELIGIPYASERVQDRWFLGLPNKKYHNIVFICINGRSETKYFIFPSTFCSKYQDKFGTDKKAKQIKFNISLKNGIYTLIIPGSEPISINEYINKFENIQH